MVNKLRYLLAKLCYDPMLSGLCISARNSRVDKSNSAVRVFSTFTLTLSTLDRSIASLLLKLRLWFWSEFLSYHCRYSLIFPAHIVSNVSHLSCLRMACMNCNGRLWAWLPCNVAWVASMASISLLCSLWLNLAWILSWRVRLFTDEIRPPRMPPKETPLGVVP